MKRFLIMLCAVALLLVSAMLGVSADLQTDADFDCAYSWGPADSEYHLYGATSVTRLTADEAAAAGIPAGYTGDVLSVKNSSKTSMDILFDFSPYRIPTALVKSITFRVYVGEDGTAGDDYPEVRIRQKGDRWVMRYDVHKKLAQWVDITIDSEGGHFEDGRSMEDISLDGYLDKAALMLRCNVANVPFYIDSITCELEENTTAPVLNYEGASTVLAHEGAQLVLNVTAIDPEEGEVEVKYEWSDPNAQNADGTLNRGEYTLKIYAEDYFGNRAEMTLPVSVGDGDNEAPVITVSADEIRAVVGARPSLKPTATDNSGYAKVEGQWSAGAIDRHGKLTVGVHTYTVTATDASENRTVKAITVYVSNVEAWGDNLIDEANPPQPEPTPTPTPPGGGENDGNNDNNNSDNNSGNNDNNNNDNNNSGDNDNNNDNNDNGNGGSESDEPPVQDEGKDEETDEEDSTPAADSDGGDLYVGIAIGIGCGALIASLIFGVILAIRSREKRDW